MNSQALIDAYTQILKDEDLQIFGHGERSHRYNSFQGIFLPSVSTDYQNAAHKIMVIGRETKSWAFFDQQNLPTTIEEGVQRSVEHHQKWFHQIQTQSKNKKGGSFVNFMRSLSNRYGAGGVVHANLYCMSLHKGNPSKSRYFNEIKELSKKLIVQQIAVLQPDIIIFANGSNSAKYRAEFFPIKGEQQVCFRGRDWVQEKNIANKHLWKFYLYDTIPCYRIQHPSARGQNLKQGKEARKFLVENLLQL